MWDQSLTIYVNNFGKPNNVLFHGLKFAPN